MEFKIELNFIDEVGVQGLPCCKINLQILENVKRSVEEEEKQLRMNLNEHYIFFFITLNEHYITSIIFVLGSEENISVGFDYGRNRPA